MKIQRLQEDYEKERRIKKTVESIIHIKSIAISKEKTTMVAYLPDQDTMIEWDTIALYATERQVVVMPLENYLEWAELHEPMKYQKIIDQREQEELRKQELSNM